jgi:tetratricopeptide (TPR) repeat protein
VATRDRGEHEVVGLLSSPTTPFAQPLGVAAQLHYLLAEMPKKTQSFPGMMRTEIARLEALEKAQQLTPADRIDLAAYHILLRDLFRAERLLSAALTLEPDNFMVLANLATCYFVMEDYPTAIRFQSRALAAWPQMQPGWTTQRLRWYRRVELATLDLMQKRMKEKARPRGRGFGVTEIKLDDLFPGVKFVGADGHYAAGSIDMRMYDKLPSDALALVEQLLLSVPHDRRLQWLLAELLNAQGEVIPARHSINALVELGFPGEKLREHRRILNDANPVSVEKYFTPGKMHEVLYALSPRCGLQSPGGAIAYEFGRTGALLHERSQNIPELGNNFGSPSPDKQPAAPPESDDLSWLPKWKTLAIVGFPCGVVLGMLLLSQFRQIFGRARGAANPHRLSPSQPESRRAGSVMTPVQAEDRGHD